jgi:hypothetical protein
MRLATIYLYLECENRHPIKKTVKPSTTVKQPSTRNRSPAIERRRGYRWNRGRRSDHRGAKCRLGEYGPNEVAEKKTSPLIKFGKKFWGVTPWMLELTVALELALSKTLKADLIAGLLCFNAIIGARATIQYSA